MEAERAKIALCHTQRHAVGRESLVQAEAVSLARFSRNRLHAFRHTKRTLMDRLTGPLRVCQERLGHSDPSLTTHVAREDDVRLAEQLDAILHGSARGEENGQTDAILRPNAPKKEDGSGVSLVANPSMTVLCQSGPALINPQRFVGINLCSAPRWQVTCQNRSDQEARTDTAER